MLTGPWIDWLAENRDQAALLATWIEAGHQVALHSHTHNHTFRDGYTNARNVFGPDDDQLCWRLDKNSCTLDALLQGLLELLPPAYTITFAAIGPHGNGGSPPYWGPHDNSCNPQIVNGTPQADEDGCIQQEWVGTLAATLSATSGAYPGLTPETRGDPAALLGDSRCVLWGEAASEIYYLPHAPFETESGKTEVTLSTVEAALDQGGAGDFIGIVIHPLSYVSTPTSTFAGNGIQQVQALFDALEQRGIRSRTLAEVRAADLEGGGATCR